MSLRVVFLGTSASIPTMRRNLPSIAVMRRAELFMFDCGEGTQRQLMRTGLGLGRKTRILVSHMHGDHVLGLPGLLQTMAMMGRERPLHLYGPPGLSEFIDCSLRSVHFQPDYRLELHETTGGNICEEHDYVVTAAPVTHTCFALGYALEEKPRPGRFNASQAKLLGVPEGPLWKRLQLGHSVRMPSGVEISPSQVLGPPRPGLKFVYTGDTSPSDTVLKLAEGADLLIHDGTFASDMAEKAASEGHSTAAEAASVAKGAKVRQLALTHISARYEDAETLAAEARAIFQNTVVAEDLMEIVLRYTD
ncbi:MAG: ribonuclease Z [Candidatus Bathyarchaeia archaeon]